MTALKPIDGVVVIPAEATTYPSNTICAHPECDVKVTLRPDGTPTVHHCFPRGLIHSDSYFVRLMEVLAVGEVSEGPLPDPIPHAVGLCGSGTTGHHGDAEDHRAWIKLEDGVFNWYDRADTPQDGQLLSETFSFEGVEGVWRKIGPLNPQPGSVEAKPKRRVFKGEQKRNRANWQIKVPKDNLEDGAGILDELFEAAWEHVASRSELNMTEGTPYTHLCAVFAAALQS